MDNCHCGDRKLQTAGHTKWWFDRVKWMQSHMQLETARDRKYLSSMRELSPSNRDVGGCAIGCRGFNCPETFHCCEFPDCANQSWIRLTIASAPGAIGPFGWSFKYS